MTGNLILTAWPWITNVLSQPGQGTDLTNTVTGERRHVDAAADEQLACSPTWCRVNIVGVGTGGSVRVRHRDGTGSREIGPADAWPAVATIAALDRFAVVASPGGVASRRNDKSDQPVRPDHRPARPGQSGAVDVGTCAGFLWWSTGSGESLTWRLLDLRTVG